MEKIKRAVIVLFFTIILILFLSGLQVITGDVILINKDKSLSQKDEITKISISPNIIKIDKIGGFVIKDKINVEVIPGSAGAYKKIEFFKKGSSRGFEEFNLKCSGFSCRNKIIGSIVIDAVKWKTGKYVARVKDVATQKYITTEFSVENKL